MRKQARSIMIGIAALLAMTTVAAAQSVTVTREELQKMIAEQTASEVKRVLSTMGAEELKKLVAPQVTEEVQKQTTEEVKKLVTATTAEELKKKVGITSADEIKKLLGLSLYVQAGYGYNYSRPLDAENGYRVFDHKSDNFTLDLAQIVLQKDAEKGGAGYKLKLSFGETAKFIHSRGLNGASEFDVTEAYIQYVAPVGKGIKFDLGKFVTPFGGEVIEAKDNMNYSRGFLFNYAIPFTHTGLRAGYQFTDSFGATAYLVNGWDNSLDNNRDKSLGLVFTYAPSEKFSTQLGGMWGTEQNDNYANGNPFEQANGHSTGRRYLIDWVATFKPIKNLTLALNADYAEERYTFTDVFTNYYSFGASKHKGRVNWKGVAAYAKYEFNDMFSIAARGEIFDDPYGVRTGMGFGTGSLGVAPVPPELFVPGWAGVPFAAPTGWTSAAPKQRLTEFTITPEIKLAGGMVILRPEYRRDFSTVHVYPGNGLGMAFPAAQNFAMPGSMYSLMTYGNLVPTPLRRNQDTISLGVMFNW